ncbi:MAG: hypothetical protein G01um10148_877 [Parcubacteria group bacterium Gr01-1014_8]|nr:MAG: hypothetical protein G01um10148_877 [Parcubacteria group bacterium Gr01-1014_8]
MNKEKLVLRVRNRSIEAMMAVALFCAVFAVTPFASASGSDYYYDNNYYQGSYNDNYYNYGNYNYNKPTCSMTLTYGTPRTSQNYNSIYDEPATLSWTTSYANSAYISPDVGSVGISGSRIVYPRGNQTYTMRVNGSWGEGNCQVTAVHPYASVYNSFYHSQPYVQPYNYGYTYPAVPAVSYVALKQMPYTGVGFGPMGTAMLWLSIILLGAVGAGAIATRNETLRKLVFLRG